MHCTTLNRLLKVLKVGNKTRWFIEKGRLKNLVSGFQTTFRLPADYSGLNLDQDKARQRLLV